MQSIVKNSAEVLHRFFRLIAVKRHSISFKKRADFVMMRGVEPLTSCHSAETNGYIPK